MVLQTFLLCTVVRKIVFVPSLLLLAGAMLSDKRNTGQNFEFQSSSPSKPHHFRQEIRVHTMLWSFLFFRHWSNINIWPLLVVFIHVTCAILCSQLSISKIVFILLPFYRDWSLFVFLYYIIIQQVHVIHYTKKMFRGYFNFGGKIHISNLLWLNNSC